MFSRMCFFTAKMSLGLHLKIFGWHLQVLHNQCVLTFHVLQYIHILLLNSKIIGKLFLKYCMSFYIKAFWLDPEAICFPLSFPTRHQHVVNLVNIIVDADCCQGVWIPRVVIQFIRLDHLLDLIDCVS